MTLEEALKAIDKILKPRFLNNLQELVFSQSWVDKTYQEMAVEAGYDEDYIRGIGFQLWKQLSESLGEKVTKSNFRTVLRRHLMSFEYAQLTNVTLSQNAQQLARIMAQPRAEQWPRISLELPEGPVSLDSLFYMERYPIEARCYQEILKPGALIRLRAPRQMGKTSLKNRILAFAASQRYATVRLNFEQVDEAILGDLNRCLRWLCATTSQQLHLETALDRYWNTDFGAKSSCTIYFQAYLLENIHQPIVLALDEVNRLFEYPAIAQNIFPLLRSWYEEARDQEIWQKLRLIVVHSTEAYVPLDVNQSPFNVGVSVRLPDFTTQQVYDLAQLHGLESFTQNQAATLIDMVGGHPQRIRLALHTLSLSQSSLDQLLQTAATSTGIYGDLLRQHWLTLQQQPTLMRVLKQVLQSEKPTPIDPLSAYQLESMGLVTLMGDHAVLSCKLYSLYFHQMSRFEG